jgi:hypothetical protein
MALQEVDRKNFNTMLKAAKNGHLALVESRRNSDGSYVALIAMVYQEPSGEYVIVPVGEMVAGNPFELYQNPEHFGGPHEWSPREKKKK